MPLTGSDGGPDGSTCLGPTPYCTRTYAERCEDSGFAGRCVDGAWVCDPCVLGPEFCERDSLPNGECSRWARDAPLHGVSVAESCGAPP